MIYVATADITARLGEEAFLRIFDRDLDGVVSGVDLADAESACSGASSLADSYIAKWIPALQAAVSVPGILTEHCIDIAVYLFVGNDYTEAQRKRYDDALRWLRDVQAGKASLGIPPLAEADSGPDIAVMVGRTRHMTRATLRGIL